MTGSSCCPGGRRRCSRALGLGRSSCSRAAVVCALGEGFVHVDGALGSVGAGSSNTGRGLSGAGQAPSTSRVRNPTYVSYSASACLQKPLAELLLLFQGLRTGATMCPYRGRYGGSDLYNCPLGPAAPSAWPAPSLAAPLMSGD